MFKIINKSETKNIGDSCPFLYVDNVKKFMKISLK